MANLVKTGDFSMKVYIMITITLFFVQLMFMAIGVTIGVIAPKIKSVLSVSLSTVFGLFIVNMISSIIKEDLLRFITPFKYYDSQYIIKNGAYETPYVILEIIIVAAAIGVSYWIYSKKDIHSI
jgi:ABC-2 type transport system permease protein